MRVYVHPDDLALRPVCRCCAVSGRPQICASSAFAHNPPPPPTPRRGGDDVMSLTRTVGQKAPKQDKSTLNPARRGKTSRNLRQAARRRRFCCVRLEIFCRRCFGFEHFNLSEFPSNRLADFSPHPASENKTAHAPFHSDIRGDITVAASPLLISGEIINNPAQLRVPSRFHRLPNRGGACRRC